jgi:hypothetical protein
MKKFKEIREEEKVDKKAFLKSDVQLGGTPHKQCLKQQMCMRRCS